jgi:hypothetical protein
LLLSNQSSLLFLQSQLCSLLLSLDPGKLGSLLLQCLLLLFSQETGLLGLLTLKFLLSSLCSCQLARLGLLLRLLLRSSSTSLSVGILLSLGGGSSSFGLQPLTLGLLFGSENLLLFGQ